MNFSTSFGILKSRSSMPMKRFTGGRLPTAMRMLPGTKANMRASMRMVISGAWPARQKVFSTSPTRIGSGSVRWKVWPSSFGLCAMWSIASATKSTGTMLMRPPSMPSTGTHCGSNSRNFLMRVKK